MPKKKERPKSGNKGTDLEVRPDRGLMIVPPPSYIEHGNAGLEDLRPQDLVLPRLVLMQQMTPAVIEKRMESGAVLNSLTNDTWFGADEAIEFIPLMHYLEWIEWGDRDSQEGMLARSVDPASELALRAQNGATRIAKDGREVRAVTEYHNFVAVFPDRGIERMVVISCARTNYKKGRKLITLARYRGDYPLFAGKYRISTVLEKNRQGMQYYVFEFENAGWCPEDLFISCKKLFESLRRVKSFSVDHEREEHESVSEPQAVDTEL